MYTFIVNPNARSGLGYRVWQDIEPVLKDRDVNYQVLFTRYQRHATSLVRELTSDLLRHTLVILGGDGTVNEVINGIADLSKVTVGYIPIGSSNDFARGLKLSSAPLEALNRILTPTRYLPVNVGILSYQDKQKRFAVSSGIGFDAGVCHQVMVSKLKVILNKLKLGKLTYTGVALHRMLTLTPGPMTVTLDGTKTIHFDKVLFTAAMNLKYEGGGFAFCPKADPADDRLNIIVIAGISKLKALLLLPTAFFGLHVHFKGIHLFTCRTVGIVSEAALPVHADGEPVFLQKELEMSLEADKLRIIAS